MATTVGPDTTEGLRARNRERTARQLQQAAWELVAEKGFEALTADAVADRAGVSRRTFFNYYPRIELVLRENLRQAVASLVDRFIARPIDESPHESLIAILDEPLDAEVLGKSIIAFGQARLSDEARSFVREAEAAEVEVIARAIAERGGPGTNPLYAQVLARATMAAGCAATEAWVEEVDGFVDDTTRARHLELLQQAFAFLATAFAPGAMAAAGPTHSPDIPGRD
ncbi:TetR/AcrR family transcriptional regulator [Knoellia subterranea]|nr:TetR/AcrR family transcriptional regulator [Knoellia subterranea]